MLGTARPGGSLDGHPGQALSPDGKTLALGEPGGGLYDLAARKPAGRLAGAQALCVAFRPDGKRLASGGYDRRVKVWDLWVLLPQ